jgi:two-component system chemotaxis response regulator CheB
MSGVPPGGWLVVLAASAGGLEGLWAVLAPLPADFPAPIVVLQHRGASTPDLLPIVLGRRTALRVRHARDGERPEPGTVYVCPPGTHMTAGHALELVAGPRLNAVRPSADLMFQSAARAYGPRAVAVVLSGTGADGAIGGRAVVAAGGTLIAQEPASAAHRGMPEAAVAVGPATLVLPPEQIGPALLRLVTGTPGPDGRRSEIPAPAGGAGGRPRTTILLVDDHRIVLDGLRVLLRGEPDMTVVAEAEDGGSAVRLAAEWSPDVVVMDLAMPGLDGLSATRDILARDPAVKVVALTAFADDGSRAGALAAGAVAVLSKQRAFDDLIVTIRGLAAADGRPAPAVTP